MLRATLLGFAVFMTCAGLVCLLAGFKPAWPITIWGAILVAAVLCERWRYRPREDDGSDGWQKTGEQFVDPESGKLVHVLYRPETGERRYTVN